MSRRTRKDSRRDIGSSSTLTKKVVWKLQLQTSGKMERLKETGRPVFTSASVLSRGILRKLKGEETIHINADAANTELVRIIHPVNQLSINGAVSNWCEEFGLRPNERESTSEKFAVKGNSSNQEILKSVNSQELDSLVCSKDTTSIWKQIARMSSEL